jgi:hypothetical protein
MPEESTSGVGLPAELGVAIAMAILSAAVDGHPIVGPAEAHQWLDALAAAARSATGQGSVVW